MAFQAIYLLVACYTVKSIYWAHFFVIFRDRKADVLFSLFIFHLFFLLLIERSFFIQKSNATLKCIIFLGSPVCPHQKQIVKD